MCYKECFTKNSLNALSNGKCASSGHLKIARYGVLFPSQKHDTAEHCDL
jgi:hypothetical protein